MTKIADQTKIKLEVLQTALDDARCDVTALQKKNDFLKTQLDKIVLEEAQLSTQVVGLYQKLGAEVIWLRGLLEKILVEPATIKALGQNAIRASEFNERTRRAQEKVNLSKPQGADLKQETPKQ